MLVSTPVARVAGIARGCCDRLSEVVVAVSARMLAGGWRQASLAVSAPHVVPMRAVSAASVVSLCLAANRAALQRLH